MNYAMMLMKMMKYLMQVDHYLFTCTNTDISLITLGNITGFKQRRVFLT